jgi:hypothetical protein
MLMFTEGMFNAMFGLVECTVTVDHWSSVLVSLCSSMPEKKSSRNW